MHKGSQAATALLRRAARASAARMGRQQQAQELAGKLREVFDPAQRRELRDEHALNIVLCAVLREDSNAIDVGANQGAVLEEILRVAPQGQHMAFEPIPDLNEALVKRFPGVEVRQVALSDSSGTAEFSHVQDAPAYSGLRERSDLPEGVGGVRQLQVRTERLDEALPEDYVPTLLKIDVEGAELGVLQGAAETLERHRPFILFEHGAGGADLYGAHPNQVFDLLDAVGMRIFDLDGSGPYSRERFEQTFTEPIWNFLAAPR